RGGPYQEVVVPLDWALGVGDPEPHGDRRILDVAVVEVRFEVGEGGGGSPRIGKDLDRPVDPALVPQLLEHPPHALHEREVESPVVVLHVDPPAEPADDELPLVGGLFDELPTGGDEPVDAELLDLPRAGQAELLLYFQDRKSIRLNSSHV